MLGGVSVQKPSNGATSRKQGVGFHTQPGPTRHCLPPEGFDELVPYGDVFYFAEEQMTGGVGALHRAASPGPGLTLCRPRFVVIVVVVHRRCHPSPRRARSPLPALARLKAAAARPRPF